MDAPRWPADAVRAMAAGGELHHTFGAAHGVPVVVVDLPDGDPGTDIGRALTALPVIAIAPGGDPDSWDLTLADPEPAIAGALAAPIAAVTTAQVLRGSERRPAPDGLLVESLAYATLQSGPEFAAWLAGRGRRVRRDEEPRVRVDVEPDGSMAITMQRARLHNMIDAAMRDGLVEALQTAARHDGPVVLRGDGPSFCAGGDLAEFGTVTDPATAHQIRASANVAPFLLTVAERTTAVVHGACVGAGVELAAFCATVEVTSDARFRLPETRMGLLPGAGGTVSIPARIGRARTLEWLLTGDEIDAVTALDWGLADHLEAAPAGSG